MTDAAGTLIESPTRFSLWKVAYEEHAPAVLRYLARRVSSREDAEDLLHETFVRAMNIGGRLRDPGRVRSYLFTTAGNLLKNHHRHRAISQAVAVGGEQVEELESTGCPADSAVYLRGLLERLDALVVAMAPDHRTAFQLALVDGLPYQEIAERTGWSLAKVKVNVHRARRKAMAGLQEVLSGAVRRHFDAEL